MSNSKKCPFCAETIHEDAKKCRFCGEWLIGEKPKEKFNKLLPIRKYYLLWIASILAFFGTFVFSVNGYITDIVCLIIIGIFAIVGTFTFLKLLYLITRPTTKGFRLKYALLCLTGFVLFFILAKMSPPVFRYPPNETGLKMTVEKQREVNPLTDQGLRKLYNEYLSSSFKSAYTESDFVQNNLSHYQSEGIHGLKSEMHDIYIDGSEGYVDRTSYSCTDSSCQNIKEETRGFKKYLYENGKWRQVEDTVLCPRKQPYDMEPEFARAISLVSQRLSPENNFQYVKNCLYISYAGTEQEMEGAEGFFRFVPGQSLLKLDIFVSPKYKQVDDYLTAFLLAHEGEHAANYGIGLLQGYPIGCFEDEGRAFNAQYYFLTQLNEEEKNSLLARTYSSSSPEVRALNATLNSISRQAGSDFIVKATNYVKSIPYYQTQCSGR